MDRPQPRLWKFGKALFPYLLIFPAFFFVTIFTYWPTINASIQSLYSPPFTSTDTTKYVGLQNYIDLFDPSSVIGRPDKFPRVLGNTLLFVLVTVPFRVILGFFLAVLLNRKIRGTTFYRSAIFYPVLLPAIGAASIWTYMFADHFGFINNLLQFIGLSPVGWTRDSIWALPAIMIVVIWNSAGFTMIFYLAGMQQISHELYEAAQLDGANAWQQILHLTIPLLSGITLFILVTTGVDTFLSSEPLYVLGNGGPDNHSNLLLYFIYQRFNVPTDLGYAYAMTLLLLFMLLVFTVANFMIMERRANYE